MTDVYYNLNSPACFSGEAAVYREAAKRDANISRQEVRDFLEKQRTYTLYKPVVRKFKRLKTIPTGLNSDWQVDLAMMNRLHEYNDGYLYFITCIDVLSRRIYVQPIKNKNPQTVIAGMREIFERAGTHPLKLCTDSGGEFTSAAFRKFLEERDIIHFKAVTHETLHATMAERANRTIKDRLYKYFSERNTVRWVTVLPRIVDAINRSVCRTTGMRPIDVTYQNAGELMDRLYGHHYDDVPRRQQRKPKFKVGDNVRLLKLKTPFQRGLANYTDQIFKVDEVVENRTPCVYKIVDYFDRPVKGYFYERELVRCPDFRSTTSRVEKVIRWRNKRNGEGREALVQWRGHGPEFNSWVDEDAFITANPEL